MMDTARQHWQILRELETDLAKRVRSFLVIGRKGDGVLVATEDGHGFWLGKMEFGRRETRTANEPIPLNVPELIHMAQGNSHIVLLNKRGEIYSMGDNYFGQLEQGTVDNKKTCFSPQLIPIPHKFISVRCGSSDCLALTENGKVWAWGYNICGEVGESNSTNYILSPHQISELDRHRIVAVECGGSGYWMALTDQGEVYGWGANNCGQLGDGSKSSKRTPTRIPTPSPVKSMAAGDNHTLLLTRTGEVYACGHNGFGQLGLSTEIGCSASLVKVKGLPSISQIAALPSAYLSIAMSSDQRCFVWGHLVTEELEEIKISISTPLKLPPVYSTVESPLSFFSIHRYTSHSVQVPETPPSRLFTRMSLMFDNPETSDVQFVVEQRTINAHRNILSNTSDYFTLMFSERWLVPVDPEDQIVKVTIPDHSYEAFYAFLRFLYTDYLEVHFGILPEMFELASQYLESGLQQLCLSRMRFTLSTDTCCLYYPLTHRHSLPELTTFQQKLVQFASTQMSEVVNSATYQSMEPELRDNLIKSAQIFSGTRSKRSRKSTPKSLTDRSARSIIDDAPLIIKKFLLYHGN